MSRPVRRNQAGLDAAQMSLEFAPAGPTRQVLASALLAGQARLEQARDAAGLDTATTEQLSRGRQLVTQAREAVARLARERVQAEPARAALLTAALGVAQQHEHAAAEHLRTLPAARVAAALWQAPDRGAYVRAAREQLTQLREVRDARLQVEAATRELGERLELERPGYLPALAVDASPASRQAWRAQASTVEAYRYRWGVSDPVRPLGDRPMTAEQERDRGRALRVAGLTERAELTPELGPQLAQQLR